jgi:hypothetical protein
MERRDFIKAAFAASVGTAAARSLAQQSRTDESEGRTDASSLPRAKDPGELRGEMLYRLLALLSQLDAKMRYFSG